MFNDNPFEICYKLKHKDGKFERFLSGESFAALQDLIENLIRERTIPVKFPIPADSQNLIPKIMHSFQLPKDPSR